MGNRKLSGNRFIARRHLADTRVRAAWMETLEERRLLSTPHVIAPADRSTRSDYVATSTTLPSAENFQWEYSGQKLVYRFDQPVDGVSLTTHTLTTLYDQAPVLSGDSYPASMPISVIYDDEFDGGDYTLTSSDGVTWSGGDENVTVTLATNGSRPAFHLTVATSTGSCEWGFNWDGYDGITSPHIVSHSGDGNYFDYGGLGTSGWVTGHPDQPGTVITSPNIALDSADGDDTAVFSLPNQLPDGYYDAVLASAGITDGNGNHLDSDANADGDQDYVYSFFSLAGDANHDDTVDGDDFFVIDSHVNIIGSTGFVNGDFDYDGVVDQNDYNIINLKYGTKLPPRVAEANTLIATAAENPGEIDLLWNAPTDTTNVDGYRIFRSTDGVTYTQYAEVDDKNATTWADTGLLDGQKFYYRVRPFSNTNGDAVTTNEFFSVTNLPGPGQSLVVSGITNTSATLTWQDNANGESGYDVIQTNPDGSEITIPLPANSTTYTATGLAEGSGYSFHVRAYTDAQTSCDSNTAAITTLPPSDADVSINLSGPATINEGSDYSLGIDLEGADTGYVTGISVDWGDGTTDTLDAGTDTASHTYADGDNNYTITANADCGSVSMASDSLDVEVKNVAPKLTIDGSNQVAAGDVFTLNLSASDPGDDHLTGWHIDWGDGSDDLPGDATSATHQYTAAGDYTINASATDEDGTYGADPLDVNVYHAGDFDDSYGTTGAVSGSLPSIGIHYLRTSAVDSLGRLVILNYDGDSDALVVTRFTRQGGLDTTFGDGGSLIALTAVYPSSFALGADDSIYIAATTNSIPGNNFHTEITLMKINSNGLVDSSFGDDGYAYVDYPSFGGISAEAIAVDGNGYITISGQVYEFEGGGNFTALARFMPNGQLDSLFGNDGLVFYTSTPIDWVGLSMKVVTSTSGNIYIAGSVSISQQSQIAIIGFHDNGQINESFGTGGLVIYDTQQKYDEMAGFAITKGDDILFLDRISIASPNIGTIVKLTAGGALDSTFGDNGIISSPLLFESSSLTVQDNGKFIVKVLGDIRRYLPDGSTDTLFGDNGTESADGYFLGQSSLAIGGNGQIYVFNESDTSLDYNITAFVGDPVLAFTAHRTGGKLGDPVAKSVQDGGDPTQYVMLVNDDTEQDLPDGAADDSDDTADIPAFGDVTGSDAQQPVDDDLAEFTLRSIGSNLDTGTLSLTLSDPGAVHLFKSDGTELTNLSLDLSNPSANPYLANLQSGDVDVWVEGVTQTPDFTFSEVLKDSAGNEIAHQDMHMDIAKWEFIGADGNPTTGIANIPTDVLLGAVNGDDTDEVQDIEKFKIRIDGISSADLSQLSVTSTDIPGDDYTDDWEVVDGGIESRDFSVLYDGAELTTEQKTLIKDNLGLNAVHNVSALAAATTQSGGQVQRTVKLSAKQIVMARLQDEENLHKNAQYYHATGLYQLFPLLTNMANDPSLTITTSSAKALGTAAAKYDPTNKTITIQTSADRGDIIRELHRALSDKLQWHPDPPYPMSNTQAYIDDSAMEWGLWSLLQNSRLLRALEQLRPGPTATVDAKRLWTQAWGVAGFYGIYSTPVPILGGKTARFQLPQDLWDINAKYGAAFSPAGSLRFSCGQLRPIYEAFLTAKGITEADGSRLVLPAMSPTPIPVGDPLE